MATGSQSDIQARLTALLPAEWFVSGQTPIVQAILAGFANGLAFIYSALAYVRLQTRIATATDGFLDLIARDYLGSSLVRSLGQSDTSFRARILAAIIRERATRNGMSKALTQLTGRAPTIFEPQNPADTGCYGGAAIGYSVAGGYGSLSIPFQAFVTAYRSAGGGIASVAPYGVPGGAVGGGYGVGALEYGSASFISGAVLDSDIIATVNAVRPAGTTIWMRISY
jgi:hypothetical protein